MTTVCTIEGCYGQLPNCTYHIHLKIFDHSKHVRALNLQEGSGELTLFEKNVTCPKCKELMEELWGGL